MKKILITLAVVLCSNGTFWAQQISEEEALQRTLQYMNSNKSSAMARRMAPSAKGGRVKLHAAPVDAKKIYAFNREGGGFIIASGDSRTLPVLGYSTTGSIDWERMPENMRTWLKQYDEAVATLGNHTGFIDGNAMFQPSLRAEKEAVEPLIKTHWDQDSPYYDQTPLYKGDDPKQKGKLCLTGCVATSMAQVLNYYQWPKGVENGIPDYTYMTSYNGRDKMVHVDALPPVTFDWDNMLNDYTAENPETGELEVLGTEAERRAVATLMRYCGQSVKMHYRPTDSGAYSNQVWEALMKYFGFSTPTWLVRYSFVSIDL